MALLSGFFEATILEVKQTTRTEKCTETPASDKGGGQAEKSAKTAEEIL